MDIGLHNDNRVRGPVERTEDGKMYVLEVGRDVDLALLGARGPPRLTRAAGGR